MHRHILNLLRCIPCAGLALAVPAAGQSPELPNPFGQFESLLLPNGLTVWYRHAPGSATTSMAVIVPAGWDDDPRGSEQTAHLLEHVLLSDRHGRSEADLARELTSRGGSHNGVTTPDHTYYPLHISTGEAAFAVRWLYEVVAPRVFTEPLVARNRDPVAIEIGARRRGSLERLAILYLQLPSLRPPGFWKREFGLESTADRVVDFHAALQNVSAADLQRFYHRHYSPATMKLVIVTGAPRAVLGPIIGETFGELPWRPPAEPRASAVPKQGESRRFSYHADRSTRLNLMYRVASLDELDLMRLIFIEDLLRLRLLERLRRGADKSIYSASVALETRTGAAFMHIAVDVDPARERAVRRTIDEELQRITTAQVDTSSFYADRNALEQRLRVQSASPGRLVEWAANRFYQPSLHDDFPDLGEYYASVGPDSIAALARRVFTNDNRIVRVLRPPPLGAIALSGLALLVIAGVAALYRYRHFTEADMGSIRFVGRIRRPPASRFLRLATALLVLLVGGRIFAAAVHFTAELGLFTIDSPALHVLAAAALLAALTWAALQLVGRQYRKVLVFEDHVRLKSRTWRSVVIPATQVRAVRIVRSVKDMDGTTRPLPGAGDGVFIDLADRPGYLLHVRQPARLQAAVENLLARSSTFDA